MASSNPWFSTALAPAPLRPKHSFISYDRLLKDLDDAYRDVRVLQREVNEFMNDYWRRVAPWFEQLVCLEQGHDAADLTPTDYVYPASDVPQTHAEHARELKQSYRRLLKRIHPDTATTPHPMPATWLKLAQAAFERGSLYGLWQLERELDENDQIDAMLDEDAQLERLLTRLQALHAQAQHLRVSDEYALWQRAQLADVSGEDWMAAVIEQVQLKIARLRRRQALARMSALVARYKDLLAGQKDSPAAALAL